VFIRAVGPAYQRIFSKFAGRMMPSADIAPSSSEQTRTRTSA